MPGIETESTGIVGEHAVVIMLTRVRENGASIFRAALLGEKWPTTDVYVEVNTDVFPRPHFFIQVKTTEKPYLVNPKRLQIRVKRRDETRLLRIPAPTYVVGVKPGAALLSYKGYIRAVFRRSPTAISSIRTSYPLSEPNLMRLRDEVVEYWETAGAKPTLSRFGG
jgi:hypothetical protein